jgi:putative ABC transport system permease protein
MRLIDALWFRLRALRRGRLEADFDDEVQFHLEQLAARYEEAGVPRDEAMQRARRDFGVTATIKEDLREARGVHVLDAFVQDVRHGARLMLRNRAFTAAALSTVALCIGTTAAVFTVVYAVVLRPLSYPEPDRLVALWSTAPREQLPRAFVGAANYRDWVAQNESFESMALVRHIGNFNLTGAGEPERLLGARVTASLFDVLRTLPALGRPFVAAEEEPGHELVVILSDGVWARRFGRDPTVIGRFIQLNNLPHQIVGVMPAWFAYPSREFQIWVPLSVNPEEYRTRLGYSFLCLGRLRPGVTVARAQAEMDTIAARLARQYPASNADTGVLVEPMRADLVRDVRRPLLLLLAAVSSLLLIGCASLANLLIARAVARSGELVLRSALGASRPRLVLQALSELVPLLVVGGLGGIAIARLLLAVVVPLLPVTMPRIEGIEIGLPVLLFALGALVVTACLAGVWPALQVAGWDVASALRESLRGASTTLRGARLRDALVVAQIAVALVLTVSATLLARSLGNVKAVDPGFEPNGVMTLHLAIPRAKYRSDEKIAEVCGRYLDAIRRLPGVSAAGMVNRLPLGGGVQIGNLQLESERLPDGRLENVDWRTITPDYFRALGIPVIEGRDFSDADDLRAQPVGIIDQRIARAAWPGKSAVGRRFRIPFDDLPWVTIIGVVGHIRHDDVESEGRPQVYWNQRQRAQDRMALVVRTDGSPSAIVGPVVSAIRSIDPEQPVYDVRPMAAVVDRSLGQQWLTTAVLAVFAGASLVLAVIGVYGVIAYGVRQRTREFGVRMALGAARRTVLWMVLARGASLITAGVAIGTIAALVTTRSLQTLLYGIGAYDAVSFAAALTVLTIAGLLATIVPACRALALEPMTVLRGD